MRTKRRIKPWQHLVGALGVLLGGIRLSTTPGNYFAGIPFVLIGVIGGVGALAALLSESTCTATPDAHSPPWRTEAAPSSRLVCLALGVVLVVTGLLIGVFTPYLLDFRTVPFLQVLGAYLLGPAATMAFGLVLIKQGLRRTRLLMGVVALLAALAVVSWVWGWRVQGCVERAGAGL